MLTTIRFASTPGRGPRLASVVIVALLAAACGRPTRTPREDAPAALDVAVGIVAPVASTAEVEAGGLVQARTTAVIASRIVATVRELRVAAGDGVRAGQVLVVLDDRVLEAQATQAVAAAAATDAARAAAAADGDAARSGLVLAQATHARISALAARGSATPHELDDATAGLRAAEARRTAADARSRQAAAMADSAAAGRSAAAAAQALTILRAPFDGLVAETLTEVGNLAAPAVPLLRVEDTRGHRLEVRLDESRLARVTPGDRVPIAIDGGEGGTIRPLVGTVVEVARAADAGTRSVLVKVAFDAPSGVHSGQFGRARFAAPARTAIVVPASAIVRTGQVTAVFVVDGDLARLRLVGLGGETATGSVEVLAGLAAGDRVVTTPPPGLSDGRRVRIGGPR